MENDEILGLAQALVVVLERDETAARAPAILDAIVRLAEIAARRPPRRRSVLSRVSDNIAAIVRLYAESYAASQFTSVSGGGTTVN